MVVERKPEAAVCSTRALRVPAGRRTDGHLPAANRQNAASLFRTSSSIPWARRNRDPWTGRKAPGRSARTAERADQELVQREERTEGLALLLRAFGHLFQRHLDDAPADDAAKHRGLEPLGLLLELHLPVLARTVAAVLAPTFADQAELQVQPLARLAHAPRQEAAPVLRIAHTRRLRGRRVARHRLAEAALGRGHQALVLGGAGFMRAQCFELLRQALRQRLQLGVAVPQVGQHRAGLRQELGFPVVPRQQARRRRRQGVGLARVALVGVGDEGDARVALVGEVAGAGVVERHRNGGGQERRHDGAPCSEGAASRKASLAF